MYRLRKTCLFHKRKDGETITQRKKNQSTNINLWELEHCKISKKFSVSMFLLKGVGTLQSNKDSCQIWGKNGYTNYWL